LQWRSKVGKWGYTVLSAGFGGEIKYIAVILKHNFKQKFGPKYAKKCIIFLKRWKNLRSIEVSAPKPRIAVGSAPDPQLVIPI